ncbi:hypothetical protein BOX15_Mlig025013g6 [Macrostomum lignano]|uniref:G-protein coupled receptors family 1 profile domain-containing protein n=1 Tax=Macrostomum lignano TaxID=282301 RepID=A0A267FSD8_9PLAT|nr:hypothetical protein BOX15_Mlig025013g6 [Macrostomum lignano]
MFDENHTDDVPFGMVYIVHGNCTEPQTPLFHADNGPTQVMLDSLYFIKCIAAMIGLMVNLVSIKVFLSFKRRSLFISMIFYLSCCEVCFNSCGLSFELFYLLVGSTNSHLMPIGSSLAVAQFLIYLVCQVVWIIYKSSLILRNWIIVLIAWRRYRAISASLSSQRSQSRRSFRLSLLLIGLLAALLTTPRAFELAYFLCAESRQIVRLAPAAFAHSRRYSAYPKLFFVLTSPMPIVCLLVISTLMTCSLRAAANTANVLQVPISNSVSSTRDRESTNSTSMRHRRSQSDAVNRTVLVLCGSFVLCELPMLIAGIIKDFECGDHCMKVHVFSGVANTLTSMDSFANFVVYVVSIPSFRNKLRPCSAGEQRSREESVQLRRI